MKKAAALVFSLALAAVPALSSPLENFRSGGLELGGSGSYVINTPSKLEMEGAGRTFSINPRVAWFLVDFLAIRLELEYERDLTQKEYPREETNDVRFLGGFEYDLPLSPSFMPMPVLALGMGFGLRMRAWSYLSAEDTFVTSTNSKGLISRISAALRLFVTDRIAPYGGVELDYRTWPETSFADALVTWEFGISLFLPTNARSLF